MKGIATWQGHLEKGGASPILSRQKQPVRTTVLLTMRWQLFLLCGALTISSAQSTSINIPAGSCIIPTYTISDSPITYALTISASFGTVGACSASSILCGLLALLRCLYVAPHFGDASSLRGLEYPFPVMFSRCFSSL